MKYIKRLDMLLVYLINTRDIKESKILKIAKGVQTTVFLKNFIGNRLKKETIEVDKSELNLVMNFQEEGLRILYGLNGLGAYRDKYYSIKGKEK